MEVTAYLCFAVYVHRFRFQSFVIRWVIQFTYICVIVVFTWPKVERDAIMVKETPRLTKVDFVRIYRCNRVTLKSLFVYFTHELNDATGFCKNHEKQWNKIILALSSSVKATTIMYFSLARITNGYYLSIRKHDGVPGVKPIPSKKD